MEEKGDLMEEGSGTEQRKEEVEEDDERSEGEALEDDDEGMVEGR